MALHRNLLQAEGEEAEQPRVVRWPRVAAAAAAVLGLSASALALCCLGGLGARPAASVALWLAGSRQTVLLASGRSAVVYAPLSLASRRRRPAVFVLHGSYEAPGEYYRIGFEDVASERDFLVVYPQMKEPRHYDWGYPDDVGYFSELLRLLERDFHMDPERAFVCGHSAGGAMALYLQSQDRLPSFRHAAAVSAGIGGLEGEFGVGRGHPGRTMLIWNRHDPLLADFNKGQADLNETLHFLLGGRALDPVAREPVRVTMNAAEADITVYGSPDGPEVRAVRWDSVPGTHEWPTAPVAFSATRLIVDFFFSATPPAARGPMLRAESSLAAVQQNLQQ